MKTAKIFHTQIKIFPHTFQFVLHAIELLPNASPPPTKSALGGQTPLVLHGSNPLPFDLLTAIDIDFDRSR
jgi:hypothetical protein